MLKLARCLDSWPVPPSGASGTAARAPTHRIDVDQAHLIASAFLEARRESTDELVLAAYADLGEQADRWFARLTGPGREHRFVSCTPGVPNRTPRGGSCRSGFGQTTCSSSGLPTTTVTGTTRSSTCRRAARTTGSVPSTTSSATRGRDTAPTETASSQPGSPRTGCTTAWPGGRSPRSSTPSTVCAGPPERRRPQGHALDALDRPRVPQRRAATASTDD